MSGRVRSGWAGEDRRAERDSEGFGVAGWLWNGAKGCGCSGSGKVAHGKAGVDGKTCSGRAVLGWAIPIRWGRQVVAWRVAFWSANASVGHVRVQVRPGRRG